MAHSIIFYSWQSDLANGTNRTFIEDALKKAAKSIRDDETVEVEPVVERDTEGVAGSPDIAKTIFGKIERADVFVCDISIIHQQTPERPTPNPNVLIELGYALNALGEHKIIMVMNKAYGGPELLPFDLRARRTISYSVPLEMEDRSVARRSLEKDLTKALRAIFNEQANAMPGEIIKPLSLAERARVAIEGNHPDQNTLVRKYMQGLAATIITFTPIFTQENRDQWDTLFDQALDQSVEPVVTFAQLGVCGQ